MYRQIVKQLAFQLLTAFHVNVLDWHFLHIPAPTRNPPTHTHTPSLSPSLLLQYSLCQQKNKREGKVREGAGEESEKGVKEEGRKKPEKQEKSDSHRGWGKVSPDRLGG